MSNDKKYTPKEAAEAVLRKAYEILKKNESLLSSKPEESLKEEVPPQESTEAPIKEEWNHSPEIKGYVKLAKFCGYVESQRKNKIQE